MSLFGLMSLIHNMEKNPLALNVFDILHKLESCKCVLYFCGWPAQVAYHPVSGAVGNSRDQSESLMEPAELDGAGKAKDKSTKRSAGLMANWLAKKPKQS